MQPVLTVNLNTGETGQYTVPAEWEDEYLGGASLAARILYDALSLELDPLSAEAPLLYLGGPLSGTVGPAVGRFVVCGKSPATKLWGESNCGGFWITELRKAGYDGLWITGKAPEPVYLWVKNAIVNICPADQLWGMETYATQNAVSAEINTPGASIAVIGPAGESKIPFAIIMTDHGRAAARTGMGAVMGSKNLKAVAVRGTGKIPVVEQDVYKTLRTESNWTLKDDPVSTVMRELGTSGVADYFDYLGLMPKKYFQNAIFEGTSNVSGTRLTEDLLVGVTACHACVIACGRVVSLPGRQAGIEAGAQSVTRQKGPEYETIVGFGPNLLLSDLAFATRMGDLCDRFGIDTISTSNTLGLAMRLFEQGKVTKDDTGGVALEWGSQASAEAALRLMVSRQGFGKYLGDGALALARRFGEAGEAMQVKGLEIPYHDPRGASGMALVYATSPRGACHNQSDYFMVEIGQVELALGLEQLTLHEGKRKAINVARHQDWRTVCNSLVLCYFSNTDPEVILKLINAACGLKLSIQDMLRTGERGFNLKRMINIRLGLTRASDQVPKQMLKPYPDAKELFVPDFDGMLTEYYRVRGWHPGTGIPGMAKLNSLGLDFTLPVQLETGGKQ